MDEIRNPNGLFMLEICVTMILERISRKQIFYDCKKIDSLKTEIEFISGPSIISIASMLSLFLV